MAHKNQPLVSDYENLEWSHLLRHLAGLAQTQQGRERCLALAVLPADQITSNWQQQVPLRDLVGGGYIPPIDEIPHMAQVFRGAALGQVLDSEALTAILNLLQTVAKVMSFIRDFSERCPPLERYGKLIYPLPKLCTAIQNSIGPEGEVLDSASPELAKLRKAKLSLRRTIEQAIRQLLVDHDIETYIQDKFFTVRSERYVVPIRLDGRGRVKGSIYDTSDSGQTLYIEPSSIAPLNEQLLELELSEKLEVLRIYRELSGHVAGEIDTLTGNYQNLIDLDVLVAKSRLAHVLDAGPVELVASPVLDLRGARHPLLQINFKVPPVANDICLSGKHQTSLIISGPNAGGKTVVLKTAGLLHLMASCGLLVPARPESQMHLFRQIAIVMGDPQDIEASLSTFSGQLMALKPIIQKADRASLVLLDELAVGTDPATASAIAQAILEHLADNGVLTITTTHFDGLKALAVHDRRFRNGSMEFSKNSLKPTYNLNLDIPGQSYGIEVAEQLGFPRKILERAMGLKGKSGSELDHLLQSLDQARTQLAADQKLAYEQRLEMERQKQHWYNERKAIEGERGKIAEKLKRTYEEKIGKLNRRLNDALAEVKKLAATLPDEGAFGELPEQLSDMRRNIKNDMLAAKSELGKLTDRFTGGVKQVPGVPCTLEDLKVGSRVYVISLGKEAVVSKIQEGSAPVEVQAGLLKLRPVLSEIRLLGVEAPPAARVNKKVTTTRGVIKAAPGVSDDNIPFQIVDSSNSLDVRGLDQDRALEKLWKRVDQALLEGDGTVAVIHGHGSDTLKRVIRSALAKNPPYDLDFRPGSSQEGGDGVTVIKVRG